MDRWMKMRFYLEDEVIRLWKELGSTVVFITYNIEEAVYLTGRVLILGNKPAKIKEGGTGLTCQDPGISHPLNLLNTATI